MTLLMAVLNMALVLTVSDCQTVRNELVAGHIGRDQLYINVQTY